MAVLSEGVRQEVISEFCAAVSQRRESMQESSASITTIVANIDSFLDTNEAAIAAYAPGLTIPQLLELLTAIVTKRKEAA